MLCLISGKLYVNVSCIADVVFVMYTMGLHVNVVCVADVVFVL